MSLIRSTAPRWPLARRALRHLLFALPPMVLAGALYKWSMDGRRAATLGDPTARALRAAVRAFFHWRDAMSVLEHALSGLGMALVGTAILQVFYAAMAPLYDDNVATPPRLRWTLTLGMGAGVAALVWYVGYPGTGGATALVALAAVAALCGRPGQARRLALGVPQGFIGLTGGLLWLGLELTWKVYQWPTTHDTAATMLVQLAASGTGLVASSLAIGATVRRFAWLRPSPVGA
ncbi:hypothetical protein AB4Y38_35355 [Paraburkholderia sp. EG285A]|uniref:hypothetical protein n=1 Tax=Paraburkholderia sp. EG285A TaxID=3237009 RepID=UPI0034D37CAA